MRQILVIDDDMDMSRLLCHFLGRKGFQATSAFSGSKGLEKFKESNFDVVLCDFRLGDMDGVDILKALEDGLAELHGITAWMGDAVAR